MTQLDALTGIDDADPADRSQAAERTRTRSHVAEPVGPGKWLDYTTREWLAPAVAVITLYLLGAREELVEGLSFGYLLSFALIPVWVPVLKQYSGARGFIALGIAATVAGLVLTEFSSVDHEISARNTFTNTFLVLGTVCGVGVVLWARAFLSVRVIGLSFGLGMLVTALTNSALSSENPWKFFVGVPIAIVALSIVARAHRRVLQIIVLLALAIASALQDSRAFFADLLLAATLILGAIVASAHSKRLTAKATFGLFVLVAVIVYQAGTMLLLAGVLGPESQARSQEQFDRAGSVLLGGRPEFAATVALMTTKLWGYGAGTLANANDILQAKIGMTELAYDPDNGYVENFMFGSKIELHSVTGDLWAICGVLGLALAIYIAVILIRYLSVSLSNASATGLVLFLSVITLWNLGFNTIYTSSLPLILGVGLALLPVPQRRARHVSETPPV
ncbi:hypothetical protein [Planctomonas psychrotolerans]|uniref:hypothetical protein n=1 Tax=Planctomonas psychrotolerans TaxID=2528712 RepID=UPI00123B7EE6|nr:hypothetical protein [Planctomonas psychrotolerans]